MANPRRTFKAKSVPDDFIGRIRTAVESFELKAAAANLPPDQRKHLRGIVDEWVIKSVQLQLLGVSTTKRDYRLFMIKRVGLY